MRWSDIPRHPTTATLRQFAALCVVVFGYLAWHSGQRERTELACVLGLLAAGLGGVGLAQPRLLRPVFVCWMMAVFPIGYVVSRLVLALIYYGCITPLALLFRLVGRDALELRRRPEAVTYWRAKPAPTDVKRYFHPF